MLAGIAASLGAAPAAASSDLSRAYVRARVLAMNGDHSSAAELLATLRAAGSEAAELKVRTLGEALGAGRMDIALRTARSLPPGDLAADARLLLVAEAMKRGKSDEALAGLGVKGESGDLLFLAPVVRAWTLAERGQAAPALAALGEIPGNGLLSPFRDEQMAFILLKLKQPVEAEPFARRAVGSAGPREVRMRLILADGFLAAGDQARADIMLEGMPGDGEQAAQLLRGGRQLGVRIDNGRQAMSETIATLAADVARRQRGSLPIGLVQVARYFDPANSSATALLAILHETRDRHDEALELLATVPADDPLISQIRDLQVQILSETGRFDAAMKLAGPAAAAANASAADLARLGSLQSAMKQFAPAAASFQQAIDRVRASGPRTDLWTLQLLQAEALNRAGQWAAAKSALHAALAAQPEEPLILNYLGYAMLEKGEDLDTAEALIRKASELAPDNASIIDSLGWTEFKRGKVNDAIATLQKAAAQDPDQAEIQEHLGDALFTSGRRYEARFAWTAGLLTAEEEIGRRLRAKLEQGLNPANAAP